MHHQRRMLQVPLPRSTRALRMIRMLLVPTMMQRKTRQRQEAKGRGRQAGCCRAWTTPRSRSIVVPSALICRCRQRDTTLLLLLHNTSKNIAFPKKRYWLWCRLHLLYRLRLCVAAVSLCFPLLAVACALTRVAFTTSATIAFTTSTTPVCQVVLHQGQQLDVLLWLLGA